MNNFVSTDSAECWRLLTRVLGFGHTEPYVYKRTAPTYIISYGVGSGCGYVDGSSPEYLLDDIQFALFEEKLPYVHLRLGGKEDGPVLDTWLFTFTREGLVKVESYYSTD